MRLLAVTLVVAVLALVPMAVLAHGGTNVVVRGHIHPGGPIELEGEDFAPNGSVRIELRKEGTEPTELGRIAADEQGAFSITLHVPETVRPGLYQLAADGEESATTEVTVLERTDGGAPAEPEPRATEPVSNDRPSGEVIGLAAFTAAIAALALGLLWLSRTPARPFIR
jgi:hypothetical protein